MLKSILIVLLLFWSNSAFAEECGIKFGGGGKDSPWIKSVGNKTTTVNNIGGPWSFIRGTYGPCSFTVFNKDAYQGRHVQYGTDLFGRVRTGAKGGEDKGGWKTRSVILHYAKSTSCKIILRAKPKKRITDFSGKIIGNLLQTFYGPSKINDIGRWSYVKETSGNCNFTLYNDVGYSGRFLDVRNVKKQIQTPWRIRSFEITPR